MNKQVLVITLLILAAASALTEAKRKPTFDGPVFDAIQNGGFENGLNSWRVDGESYFSVSDAVPGGVAGKCIRYEKTDGLKGKVPAFSQVINFKGNAYYRLNFSYKGDGVRKPVLLIEEHFNDGVSRRFIRLESSRDWEEYKVELKMGKKDAAYRLNFFPAGYPKRPGVKGPALTPAQLNDTGDGTVCFAGFKLEKTSRKDPKLIPGPYAFKTKTVTYKKTDATDLVLYVDIPQGVEGPFPVFVIIHGGGWVTGHPKDMLWKAKPLAERGVACVRVQYRLVKDGGTFEKSIGDIMDAVEWVRQNAKQYGFDLSRFGFSGGSAGGHLSSIAAQRTPECNVYAGFCGLYDAVDRGLSRFGKADNYIGTEMADRKNASAIYQIKIPPPATILFHGDADPTIDYTVALRFADALREKGGRAETIINNGFGHGVGTTDSINKQLIPFLNREWGMDMKY
ncbi:Carboxylesterase NlhH [Pontiella sulfatireligans]|uniref:Carboxylesterase NlhH n=2 Tax=Pontiella sulfatireligans TaxID=2750658 RepID=A0A6C2UJZ8_9BACT|nr:Carboxylesterase NlhH [Pontiella sulfatireligans]